MLVNLILKLLGNFVYYETGEFESMRADALKWWNDILVPNHLSEKTISEKINEGELKNLPQDKKKIVFKWWAEQWYIKVVMSILYIVAMREIQIFMNPKLKKENDDSDY